MEAMAAAGGVTKPILYRHFGDREGLVAAIGEGFLRDLNTAIRDGLTQAEPGTGQGGMVLQATIDAYLQLVERDTELYRFLVQQEKRTGREGGSAFVQQVTEQVSVLIDGGLRALGRDPTPAKVWAVGIVGMVHATGDWWAERRDELSREAVVEALTSLLWTGLGPRPVAAAG